jgi:hypothetical protein
MQQDIEDPLAKKAQIPQAFLKGATDWKNIALGVTASIFLANPLGAIGITGAAIVAGTSVLAGALEAKKELDEVQGQRVSVVDQTKNDKINWGTTGLVAGGLLAATTPVGWVAIPATAIATHFLGEMEKSKEERELRAAQIQVSNDQVNNAYNASFIDGNNGAMASNYKTIPSDQQADYYNSNGIGYTDSTYSPHAAKYGIRKRNTSPIQEIIEQKEQQAQQPQLMGVG